MNLVPILLNALTLATILMIVALGLAIIFGLMNVINLAHGEFVTIGAYTLAFVQAMGGSYWLALLLAPIVGGGGGGRPDFAEAGGRDASKIAEMLAASRDVVGKMLAAG